MKLLSKKISNNILFFQRFEKEDKIKLETLLAKHNLEEFCNDKLKSGLTSNSNFKNTLEWLKTKEKITKEEIILKLNKLKIL